MSLRHPADIAAELRVAGAAVACLPPGSVEPVAATFEYIADEVLNANMQRLEFLPPESKAAQMEEPCIARGPRYLPWPVPAEENVGVHVGTQSSDEYGADKGNDYLTFVNPTNPATFQRMVAPFRGFVEQVCRELYGPSHRVAILSSTFVVGVEKVKTVAHVDFYSPHIITLLLPLYPYRPEDAALKYWRFDENPFLYEQGRAIRASEEMLDSSTHRIYHYRFGEGIFFSGELWHQTVPFRRPLYGWGHARCRALLGIMCAAPDALVNEASHPDAELALAAAADGYYFHPLTGEWLTPLPTIRMLSWQWLAALVRRPARLADAVAEFNAALH
mmetsp:Transcript_67784/g.126588  ORF Transcript_67784/g.126588 Transcript_67784/m.126588 type:complete len:332 (+) Transcript_67784:57-1052(+)